jgi:hypothetical protein
VTAQSSDRYGIDPADWDRAVSEIRALCQSTAQARQQITYGELVRTVRSVNIAADSFALPPLLEEVIRTEHPETDVLVTAVVVHGDDRLPGKGFYSMAKSLGYKFTDELTFYSRQLRRVYDHYSRRDSGMPRQSR